MIDIRKGPGEVFLAKKLNQNLKGGSHYSASIKLMRVLVL